jgi:hypothetical protein
MLMSKDAAPELVGTEHTEELPTQPFFVVGSDRSGTTWLRLMLNEHSRLTVPRESHFLVELVAALPLTGRLDREKAELAVQIITGHRRWPDWNIEAGEVVAAVSKLEHPSLARIVDVVFRLGGGSKPRWGDKTPIYVRHISKLAEVFPGARFIHVIRDGHDVCLSLETAGWFEDTMWHRARYWNEIVSLGRSQGARLGPERYLEVHYEDLVLNTAETLRRLCSFLGEDFEDGMLESHRSAGENIAPWEAKIHAKTMRPPESSDVRRWKREMGTLSIAVIECVAGGLMDALGQERRFRTRLLPLRAFLGLAYGVAEFTLPLRRKLGIHFPRLRRKL